MTASGLAPTPGESTVSFGLSVSFLPSNEKSLPLRRVGGSVNTAKVRRSRRMGYASSEKSVVRHEIKPRDLRVGILGIL